MRDRKLRSRGSGLNWNRYVDMELSSLIFLTNIPGSRHYVDDQTTRVDAEGFQGRICTEVNCNHSRPAAEGSFRLAFRWRSPRRDITQIRNASKPPRKPRRPSKHRYKRMVVRRSRG